MDINEEIRFKIADETFVDLTPTGPEAGTEQKKLEGDQEQKKSPYTITV